MQENLRQAAIALRGMWQWRWVALGAAWIVGIVAAAVVMQLPEKYEGHARIWVDTDSVLKPLLTGLAVQPNVEQQVGVLSRTLISRPNMEKLSRMSDLDLAAQSKEDQERLVDALMKAVQIKSTGRDNLYIVTYRDADRGKALRVVQGLTSIFVESSLGDKRKDADTAKQFIDNQIKVYEQKLTEAETRLKEFKLRHLGLNTTDGKDAFARMSEANAVLGQARLALREAENSRDALKRQLANEQPFLPTSSSDVPGVPPSELDGRIETMKRNLDALLQRYTEQHPDVAGTRRIIRELEEQKRKEMDARKPVDSAPTRMNVAATNPVYQKLRESVSHAEASVASLQARVAEYEARYARVKASMQIVPEIEAELTQLNRDYDVNKKNYETFVARRESAVISGQMDASGVAEFRLIDPPRVTPEPVWPNRPMLFALALVGALAAGLLAAFVAWQVRPSFVDARLLREAVGLPVLGTVSLIANESTRRKERRHLIGFVTGTLTLIGAYAASIVAFVIMPGRLL